MNALSPRSPIRGTIPDDSHLISAKEHSPSGKILRHEYWTLLPFQPIIQNGEYYFFRNFLEELALFPELFSRLGYEFHYANKTVRIPNLPAFRYRASLVINAKMGLTQDVTTYREAAAVAIKETYPWPYTRPFHLQIVAALLEKGQILFPEFKNNYSDTSYSLLSSLWLAGPLGEWFAQHYKALRILEQDPFFQTDPELKYWIPFLRAAILPRIAMDLQERLQGNLQDFSEETEKFADKHERSNPPNLQDYLLGSLPGFGLEDRYAFRDLKLDAFLGDGWFFSDRFRTNSGRFSEFLDGFYTLLSNPAQNSPRGLAAFLADWGHANAKSKQWVLHSLSGSGPDTLLTNEVLEGWAKFWAKELGTADHRGSSAVRRAGR